MTLLRLGFLVLLWAFVYFVVRVLRSDLYGTRIPTSPAAVPAATAPVTPTPTRRKTAGPTRLVVTSGPLSGTTIPLGSSAILIGRSPSCTLVLEDDYSSSRHARVFPQSDAWFVEDLGSTNGTFMGKEKVTGPTPLPTGKPVRVGQSTIELQR
ncbi:FHA domain containing protein [Jonesia denitrificans DSM 20603]|uniref:FHA domain containing protein n=2 Tax=Jonesia TaxID=43673 RepID=C7QYK2_JONDD|nr:FHA domain containing protein [Jonesia denitrificans DSM 20603]SQH19823.1 Uncharacterized conserved protein, contains FHA domain [Jonesia denitrificans]